LEDRIASGFIGGIIAGIAMNIIDWIGYSLGFYNERLLDWASIAIYGHLPITNYEVVFAQLGQIFFSGFAGILFSYMLLKLTSGNYLLKGWIFGILMWFGLYATSIALRLPTLTNHDFHTSLAHFISSTVYGLVLASVLNYLDKRKVLG